MNTAGNGVRIILMSDREKIVYIVAMLNHIKKEEWGSVTISPECSKFLDEILKPVHFLSLEVEIMIRKYPEIFELYGFRKTPGYFGERFKYNNKRVLFS